MEAALSSLSEDFASLSKEELQAHLQRCHLDFEKSITEARVFSFAELKSTHEKEINEALFMQEREFKTEMERAKREFQRKEVMLNAHAQEADRRREEAERRLEHITSGEETRQALERAARLANTLADEEQARLRLEEQIREKLKAAAARERGLEEALAEARSSAKIANGRAARLRRQLWLRRRQLVNKAASNISAIEEEAKDSNSSALETDFETQCLLDGGVPAGVGICRKVKDHVQDHEMTINTELPVRTLKKSIMEAMQILSPMQDLAIWRMHSDLCLAQVRSAVDPCSASAAFSASSWLAAFAWVALWRCVWVLSIRYFITCFGSFAVRTVRLWDRFSDWFYGFGAKKELATQDL